MYYYHTCDDRIIPMNGFAEKDWKRLCYRYVRGYNVAKYFPDEPCSFTMSCFAMEKVYEWVRTELLPYMTLKHPNKKHSAYHDPHRAGNTQPHGREAEQDPGNRFWASA